MKNVLQLAYGESHSQRPPSACLPWNDVRAMSSASSVYNRASLNIPHRNDRPARRDILPDPPGGDMITKCWPLGWQNCPSREKMNPVRDRFFGCTRP